MSDNVINFPGAQQTEDKIDPAIEERVRTALTPKDPPESCKNTTGYFLNSVMMSQESLQPVPDIMTGSERSRRWGAIVSLGIIPNVDSNPLGGPVILPLPPSQFFDADSLEELKERIIFELDQSIEAARLAQQYPKEYEQIQMSLALNRMGMSPDEQGTDSGDTALD